MQSVTRGGLERPCLPGCVTLRLPRWARRGAGGMLSDAPRGELPPHLLLAATRQAVTPGVDGLGWLPFSSWTGRVVVRDVR